MAVTLAPNILIRLCFPKVFVLLTSKSLKNFHYTFNKSRFVFFKAISKQMRKTFAVRMQNVNLFYTWPFGNIQSIVAYAAKTQYFNSPKSTLIRFILVLLILSTNFASFENIIKCNHFNYFIYNWLCNLDASKNS